MATLLSHPAVAAFIGAFSAFILVVANDWRRRRRKKNMLTFLVDENAEQGRLKIESVRTCIDMIENNRFTDAPIMKFRTVALTQYHHEVMDLLDANENQALSGLIYWMESIDEILDDAKQTAVLLRQLAELNAPNEQRSIVGERLLRQFRDAERNLEYLSELCGYYVQGEPHRILEFQHKLS